MRKRFVLMFSVICFFFMFFISKINAQVYAGNLTLTTQAQVDAFNYTEIDGSLTITGFEITNLDGLSELVKIEENLFVQHTYELLNVNGLFNLKEVMNTIYFKNNRVLIDLYGLSALEFTSGLQITGNALLTNIDGLVKLERLGFSGCVIQENPALTTAVFARTEVILGSLLIEDNRVLSSVQFSNLTRVNDAMQVLNNASLEILDLPKLKEVGVGLILAENESLLDIGGLSALETIGYLRIRISEFSNIDALSNVKTLFALDIQFNPNLINIDGL